MNILVVGNGFDLAHGLPTTYKDFLLFLKQIEGLSKLPSFGNEKNFDMVQIEGLDPDDPNGDNLLNNAVIDFINSNSNMLKQVYKCIENNIWYYYFLRILENKEIGKNWIDFEQEIKAVVEFFDHRIKDLDAKFERPRDFSDKTFSFYDIVASNKPTLIKASNADFINILYEDLSRLIWCLELYLDCCVNNIHITTCSPDIKNLQVNAVLSFNYTNTFERIYGSSFEIKTSELLKPNKYPVLFHYIHGIADFHRRYCENNMVLGVDEYWSGDEKNTNSNFNLFKKFVQRIMKNTGANYKKWFGLSHTGTKWKRSTTDYNCEKLYPPLTSTEMETLTQYLFASYNKVYMYGHSLDITDRDIITDLIKHSDSTTIYYHSKLQQAQQIANLTKALGQDTLIEYVFSAEPKIIFKRQQSMEPIPTT